MCSFRLLGSLARTDLFLKLLTSDTFREECRSKSRKVMWSIIKAQLFEKIDRWIKYLFCSVLQLKLTNKQQCSNVWKLNFVNRISVTNLYVFVHPNPHSRFKRTKSPGTITPRLVRKQSPSRKLPHVPGTSAVVHLWPRPVSQVSAEQDRTSPRRNGSLGPDNDGGSG